MNNQLPPCPKCGRKSTVVEQGVIGDSYFCRECNMGFDDDPDEGGTYSDRNPAARLEREERRQQRVRRK